MAVRPVGHSVDVKTQWTELWQIVETKIIVKNITTCFKRITTFFNI